MWLPKLLPAIVLMACASSGAPAPRVTTDPVVFQGELSVVGVDVVRSRDFVEAEITQPFDEVWRVIPQALGRLGLSMDQVDPKAGSVTTRATRFRGALDGSRLSTFFECGQSSMGKTADRYQVIVKVTTSVRGAGEGRSMLGSMVSATAKPDDSGVSVSCDSNGNLEKRIHNLVVLQFAGR